MIVIGIFNHLLKLISIRTPNHLFKEPAHPQYANNLLVKLN